MSRGTFSFWQLNSLFESTNIAVLSLQRSAKERQRNHMRLDHDMGPMSQFAPFFTDEEFELLYDDKQPVPDEDELTATWDNDGGLCL